MNTKFCSVLIEKKFMYVYTVEPLYKEHAGTMKIVLYSEDYTSIGSKQVSLIQSVLHKWFHCISITVYLTGAKSI